MSGVWFTSDLHLGHDKVTEERRHWCGDDHDGFLADAWNHQVKPADLVWVLGDISSGRSSQQTRALEWISQRPGRKRIVLGNHDGPHPMHRDAHRWAPRYGEVFEHVTTAARMKLAGGYALLSHFPYVGDHTLEDRHTQWRLRDEGLPVIHGHTHSEWVRRRWVHKRQLHVGIDAWQNLVSLDVVHDLTKDIFRDEMR